MSSEVDGSIDQLVKEELRKYFKGVRVMEDSADAAVDSKIVEIVEDFRDQPHGHSKPNLKGKRYTVSGAVVTGAYISLWLNGVDCAVPIGSVRFV